MSRITIGALLQTQQLLGFTGSRGDLGYTGSTGGLGYTGSQGAGFTGSQGIEGYTGSAGVGFTGSVGTQGAVGFTGSVGTQGTVGYTGSQGDIGFTGSAGVGFTGSQGIQGVQGVQGVIGYTGSQAISSTSLRLISLVQPGTITVPYTGIARFYPVANLTISNVYASLGTASTTNFSFVIQKNDSNINTYTINANAFTMPATSANIVVNTTDYLTIDVSAGTGATDLRVDLEYNYQ